MKQSDRGFTLIELMIAVAVVAILAAVAFPSYQDSIRKTRRADAKVALEEIAALQERWFTEKNSYSNNLNTLLSQLGTIKSDEGFYTITMTNVGCVSGTYVGCFDLTATATGPQTKDTDCDKFTLDETGVRGSNKKGGAVSTGCW